MGCGDCISAIAHVSQGVSGLVKAAVGIDRPPEEVIRQRRDACRGCDRATRNPARLDRPAKGLTSLSQCRECGCLIAAKTAVASEQCPLGKWQAWAAQEGRERSTEGKDQGREEADRTADNGPSIDN
jgi:hypothetical protein